LIGLQLQRVWTPARLRKPRRGLRVYQLGLALALLFLLHGLLVNLLLLSGALGGLLSRATGVVHVQTGYSFSLWPGVVQLRQLQLEVTDSNVHLQLEVPSGRANILLRELLRRRFVAKDVTGEHFALRVRPKFEQLPEPREAALPPLSAPVTQPSTGEVPYLWPMRIQGTDAQYDELWISEVRYRGDARVAGGFELVPLERVTVEPSHVQLRGGALTYGAEQRVFDVQAAQLHGELPETRVEELQHAWREKLAVRVELTGNVVDLGFAENLDPALDGVSGGQAELTLRAAAERGEWVGPFELEYSAPRVAYANGDWRGSLALSVATAAAVAPEPAANAGAELPLTLSVQGLALDMRGRKLAELERCQLDLKLTRRFPFGVPRAASLNLQGLQLEGLERLPAALRPADWVPSLAQLPRARAAFAWKDGVASGGADLRFRELSFRYRDWWLRQDGALRVEGVQWKGPGFKLRSSGITLELDSVQIRRPGTQIDDWKLRVELDQVAFAPNGRRLSAAFLVAGDDARPVLSLLGVSGLARGASDFLAMPDLRVRGSIDLSPERQDITVERAESKTIDVRGRLIREQAQNHAALLFKAAPLSLGVDVQPADTSVRLFASEAWLNARLDQLEKGAPSAQRP
jgi:hypothetical protein